MYFIRNLEINNMRMKDGKTTANVAVAEPRMPIQWAPPALTTAVYLRNGHDIRELAHRHPMVVRHNLALNHGDHCVATAETEEADEEEGVEELEEDHSNV